MSPRHWHKQKAEVAKAAHRPIEEIKRDIATTPVQGLAALQAELLAALDAERG